MAIESNMADLLKGISESQAVLTKKVEDLSVPAITSIPSYSEMTAIKPKKMKPDRVAMVYEVDTEDIDRVAGNIARISQAKKAMRMDLHRTKIVMKIVSNKDHRDLLVSKLAKVGHKIEFELESKRWPEVSCVVAKDSYEEAGNVCERNGVPVDSLEESGRKSLSPNPRRSSTK